MFFITLVSFAECFGGNARDKQMYCEIKFCFLYLVQPNILKNKRKAFV